MQSQELNDLPLNGRDYDQLVLTQPGIFRDNTVSNPAEGLFSANGNLQLQNYFQLDGIDNNSKSENLQEQSTQSVIPPPDALQEFVAANENLLGRVWHRSRRGRKRIDQVWNESSSMATPGTTSRTAL